LQICLLPHDHGNLLCQVKYCSHRLLTYTCSILHCQHAANISCFALRSPLFYNNLACCRRNERACGRSTSITNVVKSLWQCVCLMFMKFVANLSPFHFFYNTLNYCKIKGYAERSMICLQHVDNGELNKCILKACVNSILLDTVNSWTQ
jgi:hypothetical protein